VCSRNHYSCTRSTRKLKTSSGSRTIPEWSNGYLQQHKNRRTLKKNRTESKSLGHTHAVNSAENRRRSNGERLLGAPVAVWAEQNNRAAKYRVKTKTPARTRCPGVESTSGDENYSRVDKNGQLRADKDQQRAST
jgi:hypothetical protein